MAVTSGGRKEKWPWWAMEISQVLEQTGSSLVSGLSKAQAEKRLRQFGPNTLPSQQKTSYWRVFLEQFQDFMVIVLLAATFISLAMGEWEDGVAILTIVFLNAMLGFIQEYRAERSLEALRRLSAPVAKVLRNGEVQKLPAEALVFGDVVLLEAGDRVPADLRLVETWSLEIEEAALTGESLPVAKTSAKICIPSLPLAERQNMAFMSTMVTRGRGTGVVIATGTETELGKIARLIGDGREEPTPLQRRLDQLGRWLVLGCLVLCVLVFLTGIWRGRPVTEMFLTAVSLAVAAIPEGLPAIVTVALALGVQRMSRRRAVIRHLPVIETLGNVTVICADKTGTLTENRMRVEKIWLDGRGWTVEEVCLRKGQPAEGQDTLTWFLRTLAFCHGVCWNERTGKGEGDPTELGLVEMAVRCGMPPQGVAKTYRRAGEIPFTSERRMMTVVGAENNGRLWAFTKGAPDVILPRCSFFQEGKMRNLITAGYRQRVTGVIEKMASEGLRVLAVAYRPLKGQEKVLPHLGPAEVERDLIFLGLVGLQDPPRPEAVSAIRQAQQAGIRTVMITGDHAQTARAVAKQLGLPTGRVLTGSDLDTISDEDLARVVAGCYIFARVSPEHKLRLVRAWRARDEVVAMTGDGVNDAPAIREADVGIAMGKNGTDVAREAAAMVLTDDNYATIVAAVEEGRGIYENIRRFIRYLLTCNVGEILTMALAILAGFPLPLLPLQILWMNLVTDGLPAIALGVDPPSEDLMHRPPRPRGEAIFTLRTWQGILVRGTMMALATLWVFLWGLAHHGVESMARTMAFTTIVCSQLVYAIRCGFSSRGLVTNLLQRPVLSAAVLVSFFCQLVVLYLPGMGKVFRTIPLQKTDWLVVMGGVGYATFLYDLAAWLWYRWVNLKKEFLSEGGI